MMNSKEIAVKSHQLLSFNGIFSTTGKGKDVFWPGCAVLAMGEEITNKTYDLLKTSVPGLTYSTSCCGKPSRYINGGKDFKKRKELLERTFQEKGTKNIYTLCPNCFITLGEFSQVKVQSAWRLIDEYFPESSRGILEGTAFSLHDPCPIVKDIEAAEYARSILRKMGIQVMEFKNNRENTMCCGKKNMLMALEPEKGMKMFQQRALQAPTKNIVTYCASCRDTFKQNSFASYHILELLFQAEGYSSWMNRYRAVKSMKRRNEDA